ncbi:MAG: CD225/dispanin family protein [Planctomycetes bacterium]|nr:CD225/dispanin family protein [Planctomycetota bacterium]
MFCPKCGQELPDDVARCYSCGEPVEHLQATGPVQQRPPLTPIPSNLVWAILTTLFCCLPFGIVAIVYAAQVDGKTASGDYAGAREASNKARTWSFVAFLCGLIPMIIYIILIVIGVLAGAADHNF